eukprot:353037-Chlamydomonas_euryale.AAC.5
MKVKIDAANNPKRRALAAQRQQAIDTVSVLLAALGEGGRGNRRAVFRQQAIDTVSVSLAALGGGWMREGEEAIGVQCFRFSDMLAARKGARCFGVWILKFGRGEGGKQAGFGGIKF